MTVITPFYAALLGIMGVALSLYVVRLRRRLKAATGDHGDVGLARAIRAHGNFSEYAPFGIVLMFAAEFAGALPWLLHTCGILLILGRMLHAAAFILGWRHLPLRVAGMFATLTSLVLASLAAATFSIV